MKKGTLSTVILIVVFLAGLSLLLYPTVSDYWNDLHQSKAVSGYVEQVAQLDNDQYDILMDAARAYNAQLLEKQNPFLFTDEEKAQYEALLNVAGNGVMGYIEIPTIGVTLPVYHGVEEKVLQVAIGHLPWSSLPVGGVGNHSVVSGHRGLPSAKLFSDLDDLVLGDTFVIRTLDEIMTYEVDQILVVEPQEVESLLPEPGKDLMTLVTCTPYGINSHRLLVRGHRVENAVEAKEIRVTADAMRIEPLLMAPLVAAPMLAVLLVVLLVTTKKRK